MKKNSILLILLVAFIFGPIIAKAENINVAEVNNEGYTTIEAAMEAAEGTDYEVKLLSDVTLLETKIVDKNLTINLNGFNIQKNKLLFEVKGATFTVKGEGVIKETTPYLAPVAVYGAETPTENYTIVNIGKDVTLEGWSGLMVRQSNKFSKPEPNANNNSYGVVVNFEGTAKGVDDITGDHGIGIYINGSIKNAENQPIINIKDATLDETAFGIMAQGNSVLNINGAEITGVDAGIAIKSGNLNIKNSTITGSGEDKTPTQGYNDGTFPSGAALQIESNNGYYGNINVNIENSKLESKKSYAYYEYVAATGLDTEVKSISIKDTELISGDDKSEFKVSDSYKEKYTKNITVEKIKNATLTIDKSTALVGEKVSVYVLANEGYELKNITFNGEDVTLKDNSFNMLNNDVKVSGSTIKIETTTELPTVDINTQVEEVKIGIKESEEIQNVLLETLKKNEELVSLAEDKAIKIEVEIDAIDTTKIETKKVEAIKKKAGNAKITNFFDITVAVKETVTNKSIATLPELTKEIELMVLLPDALKNTNDKIERKYYVVREHNDEVELINATISEDGKYLVFKSNRFSTYALAYEDNVKTSPKTGDNTLTNLLLIGISMTGFIGATYYIKKKKLFN